MAGKITAQELATSLIDTDLTSVSASDDTIPSAKATKTYADTKQTGDATLTALASLDATGGIVAETAADTFTKRTITGTTNKIVVTNGDGVSGNPTLNIGSDIVTLTDTQTLTNKTINSAGTGNTLKNVVLNYTGTVTLQNIKDGITLIAAVAGRTIKVLRYFIKSTGAFTTGTSVILQDTNSTPVVITTMLVAALTNGAKISSEMTVANVTDGAGFLVNLTADKGIAIPADAAMAGGTSLLVSIDYVLV
jgi:hypothetical protein